jgi:ribosomal-protein-serine acetyltransferase
MFGRVLRDGVELRLLEERHAAALYAHVEANRAHLGVWLEELAGMQSVDDARVFIRGGLDGFVKGSGLTLGIWVDGRLGGGIGLGNLQADSRSGMIGYWLGADYVGRGLVTDAVRVLLDYAFGERELHRVDITCPATNLPSRRIPERLGFREEGTRRQAVWVHGQPLDEVLYGMLADEWRHARRGGEASGIA